MPATAAEWNTIAEHHYTIFPEYYRTGKSLKHKFNSDAKMSGPLGDPNCPPYVRKAKTVKKKIIEKTDGSTGSNHCRGGDKSGNKRSGKELFENYGNNNNENDNTWYDPPVDKGNIPTSVVINSSSKGA